MGAEVSVVVVRDRGCWVIGPFFAPELETGA
jgi:hypothetical protein